jgi:hypothetical protein
MVLVGASGSQGDYGQVLELDRVQGVDPRGHLVEVPGRAGQHPAAHADCEEREECDEAKGHEKTTVLLP